MAQLSVEDRLAALETEMKERVAALESEVARLKQPVTDSPQRIPWWEERSGAFANSPEYEEAVRLGREYRESLRPGDNEFGEAA